MKKRNAQKKFLPEGDYSTTDIKFKFVQNLNGNIFIYKIAIQPKIIDFFYLIIFIIIQNYNLFTKLKHISTNKT